MNHTGEMHQELVDRRFGFSHKRVGFLQFGKQHGVKSGRNPSESHVESFLDKDESVLQFGTELGDATELIVTSTRLLTIETQSNGARVILDFHEAAERRVRVAESA